MDKKWSGFTGWDQGPACLSSHQLHPRHKSEKQEVHVSQIVFTATILMDMRASLNKENGLVIVLFLFQYILYAKKYFMTF